ncbi:MAG: PEGA domain-containing protein [Candidatus Aminicenantes bacterium]|nr:MAG: PEGA domain-containing protein [Candidatus Aminicenantes bacterium]
MEFKKGLKRISVLNIFFLVFLLSVLEAAPIKVKVIADNASIKATPEIGGNTIAKVPLNTILEAELKEGEWYKVHMEKEGLQISGYIHEMVVEVVQEEESPEKEEVSAEEESSQAEVLAEIDIKMEDNRKLIRQEKDFEKAVNSLRPLIAKAFNVTDNKRQKELATEIFLWIGLAFAGQGDEYTALLEFENMFEVDQSYAKEITRNIYDPKVVGLIEHAEKKFLGLVTDYALEISTEPKEAKIKIDGKEIGFSPEIYRTAVPKFVLEIEKEGYKPIKEEIFLTRDTSQKEYILERSGRNVGVSSRPSGARVYLDGKDTGEVTDCLLSYVPFGVHKIRIIKENYTEWEGEISIDKGEAPFPIEVVLTGKNYGFLKKFGGPDQEIFEQPTGIAVDKENNFYVVDTKDPKLKKFSPEGKHLSSWVNEGKEFKKLKNPAGIAIDNQGFIYITDSKNHCVMKFDKEGKYVSKWGKEGSEKQEFRNPLGIAINSYNDIYVVDSLNNRIKKYSNQGILKKIWGKPGTSDGAFSYPSAIAVNQKDEIYVLDRIRIQKFSAEGEFITSWGKRGTNEAEFNRPMGLTVDKDNYVYVADSANHRIQKFDGKGKFITQWGKRGMEDGQMNFPYSLAIDSRENILVIERDNKRVQIFRVSSESTSYSGLIFE